MDPYQHMDPYDDDSKPKKPPNHLEFLIGSCGHLSPFISRQGLAYTAVDDPRGQLYFPLRSPQFATGSFKPSATTTSLSPTPPPSAASSP